jgi:uncharacterized phage protein (TIGR01671 family)
MIKVYGLGPDFLTENTLDGVDEGTNCWHGDDMKFLIITQSTESFDKNGTEIYFGDIINDFGGGLYVPKSSLSVNENGDMTEDDDDGSYVRTGDSTRLGIVIKEDGTTRIKTSVMTYAYNLSNAAKFEDFEVVGNIYENPELLKEASDGTT